MRVLRQSTGFSVCSLLMIGCLGTAIAADGRDIVITIAPQPLGQALLELAEQTDLQIIFPSDLVAGVATQGTSGHQTPEEALTEILRGTNLGYRFIDEHTVGIVRLRVRNTPPIVPQRPQSTQLKPIQPSPPPSRSAQGERSALDEIIVTALRFQQNLQDIPMSVAALSEQHLRALKATRTSDYARSVAGLDIVDRGPNRGTVNIRGVSSLAGRTPTVGIYFDGISVNRDANSPDLYLFDIERVEILRGPQGTLYGESSMGGALKVITTKPDKDPLVRLQMGTSQTKGGNYNMAAAINIPIIDDRFSVRAVGYYASDAGWIDNVQLDSHNANGSRISGGRVLTTLFGGESYDVTAAYYFQRTDVSAQNLTTDGPADLQQSRLVNERQSDQFHQAILDLEIRSRWGNINALTGFNNRKFNILLDLQDTSVGDYDSVDRIASEEIRLSSPSDHSLRWTWGVYGQYRKANNKLFLQSSFPAPAGTLYDISETSEQGAVFGELTYVLPWHIEATLGFRYFIERLNIIYNEDGQNLFNDTRSYNAFTPKVGLSKKITPDILVYALFSQGYRSGGLNFLPTSPADHLTYDPDYALNYEVGLKSEWWSRRLRTNFSAFYIDWRNLQVLGDPANSLLGFTTNEGKAHSAGVELELTMTPIHNFTILFEANITNAVLDRPAQGGQAGDRLPRVPKYAFSLAAEYLVPLSEELQLSLRAEYQRVGESVNTLSSSILRPLGAYDIGNARVGISSERISFSLFVNNLWDERAELEFQSDAVFRNQPRTVGIEFSAEF